MTAAAIRKTWQQPGLAPTLIAAGVLLVGLFYTVVYALAVPYPGLDYDSRWQVLALENPCNVNPVWCAARDKSLRIGDQMLAIGDLTYQEYKAAFAAVPFAGSHPGDIVPVTFVRDGEVRQTTWQMLGPTGAARTIRLTGLLIFLPFWLAGTGVLLFLRPRDQLWLLLVAFTYTTAVWIAAGIPSTSHIAGSLTLLLSLSWLLLPIYVHLHLIVPSSILTRRARYFFILPLYVLSGIIAVTQFFRPFPTSATWLAVLLATGGSLILLLIRLIQQRAARARLALRLMVAGVGLAFGPGIVLWVIPSLLSSSTAGLLTIGVMTGAISILPFFYIYALYKHRLGNLEFRANRALSLFSFLVVYVTVFMFVFVVGSQWVQLSNSALAFALISSVAFVTLALPLRVPFQRLIDRLAYGTEHNPDDIIRSFANEIPRALHREALVHLLTTEVTPSLLIRQSALYLMNGREVSLFYSDRVDVTGQPEAGDAIRDLIAVSGHYLPAEPGDADVFAWVRLPIRIEVGAEPVGVWLLGKRDPDDYYPQRDVELLRTLANQIGVALETARLFDNLQRRATELEQAYAELQKLDRLKDEFVQNVSHELRTPLTIIRGCTELLLEGGLGEITPEQEGTLTTVQARTDSIIRLINDIISMQQAMLERFEPEPVNLAALSRSCLRAAEITAQKQGCQTAVYRFELDAPESVPQVWGDRGRLGQVLDNLLNNAVKFSPDGGTIAIHLRSAQYRPDGAAAGTDLLPAVEVAVSDQGIGIAAEQIGRIWERFYQVDGSSTRRFGGMGLGLAIVFGIVQMHRGKIWAESEVGKGTTFRILLPVQPPRPVDSFQRELEAHLPYLPSTATAEPTPNGL